MQGLCSSCGAPPCVVVLAQPLCAVELLNDAPSYAVQASGDQQPALAHFCVFCGCSVHATETPLPIQTTAHKLDTLNEKRVHVSPKVLNIAASLSSNEDGVLSTAVVPLSTVLSMAHTLHRAYQRAATTPLRQKTTRQHATGLCVPSAPPRIPLSCFPKLDQKQANSTVQKNNAHLLSEAGSYVSQSASSGAGTSGVLLQSPAFPTDNNLKCRQPWMNSVTDGDRGQCLADGSNGDIYSRGGKYRSRSPSIMVSSCEGGAAVMSNTAPGTLLERLPLPPRCSHTLPRHSCSYDSDVDNSLCVAARSTSTGDVRRSWSTFEDESHLFGGQTFSAQRSSHVATVDAEERAQGVEQQRAYERLRDALLRQL